MSKVCPICIKSYLDTDRSEDVCETHQDWLITTCSECGKVTFSDAKGLCMKHGADSQRTMALGSIDSSWYLKRIGQEGGPVSGF
jgi:hypothetical protein